MRLRLFTAIATCVFVLGLSGCRVHSTILSSTLAPLPYVAPGEILEFRASNSNSSSSYVVFYGNSPCAKPFYEIKPNQPARCKVLKERTGNFEYYFQSNQPPKEHLFARSCKYCQVIIVGPVNPGGSGTETGVTKPSGGTGRPYPPLPVSCDPDTKEAVVDNSNLQNGVQDQDQISWIPMSPAKSVTVTTPSGMCSGGQNGIFTAQDACTVTGTLKSYAYKVKLDQCPNEGTSTLTINQTSAPN